MHRGKAVLRPVGNVQHSRGGDRKIDERMGRTDGRKDVVEKISSDRRQDRGAKKELSIGRSRRLEELRTSPAGWIGSLGEGLLGQLIRRRCIDRLSGHR
jgi:hypothetical protein